MWIPVILSGGAGTRLWPLSRELVPKQLLPLAGQHTMLQDTVSRLNGLPTAAPLVVCNEAHRFLVAEQLRDAAATPQAILLEPVGRNTAPAIALAALWAEAAGHPEAVLMVLPADHAIADTSAFRAAANHAYAAARDGMIVTFGIVPRHAATGYGYIRRGEPVGPAYRLEAFVEKPNAARAAELVAGGKHVWNSGMFVFRADRILKDLARFVPDILAACREALSGAQPDMGFLRISRAPFEACPSLSIDHGVMEKTADAVVVPLDAGWSDVGSFGALHDVGTHDAKGNVTRGDVLSVDTQDCYVHAGSRLVATVGLKDHVVVETRDAVLVAPKDRSEDVKAIVAQLGSRPEKMHHRRVLRPWGSYESIDQGPRFQVKRLTVKPGEVLSLQMHHHRSEHWIVVSGIAKVTRGEETYLVEENQSTFIPAQVKHRIENPGLIPLEIIEVQTGSYLGEDDIVRFEDRYGRDGTQKP